MRQNFLAAKKKSKRENASLLAVLIIRAEES